MKDKSVIGSSQFSIVLEIIMLSRRGVSVAREYPLYNTYPLRGMLFRKRCIGAEESIRDTVTYGDSVDVFFLSKFVTAICHWIGE